MCLGIPSCVVSVDAESMTAQVDTLGMPCEANTQLITDVIAVGDYLLVHAGFAISKIEHVEAQESLETYKALMTEMDKEDVSTLLS